MIELGDFVTAAEGSDPPPLAEIIFQILRRNIEEGRLPDGLVLSEADVSRTFDVSRTPARTALGRLRDENLIAAHDGRGFLVIRGGPRQPLRQRLAETELQVAASEQDALNSSGAVDRIYPSLERTASSVTAFGRFMVNQTALADFYGTSRTVAQIALTRLERSGLVVRDRHARWYIERLTVQKAIDHYTIRELLEPVAIELAFPSMSRDKIYGSWRRLGQLLEHSSAVTPKDLDEVERDLHLDLVHLCPNAQMVKVINESQLPLIGTHYTAERYGGSPEMTRSFLQHSNVLTLLLEGSPDRAAEALRHHLSSAVEVTISRLRHLPELHRDLYPPYLTPVDE
jgi:DNA-binding GntR family transcriptional regulator